MSVILADVVAFAQQKLLVMDGEYFDDSPMETPKRPRRIFEKNMRIRIHDCSHAPLAGADAAAQAAEVGTSTKQQLLAIILTLGDP